MTGFEIAYRCAEPFFPPLYGMVRRRLCALARESTELPDILDVGGRKSHYTIGVPGRITVTELPRETSVQSQLNLGLSDEMVADTKRRRSNISRIVFDDMTESKLEAASFDYVVAVEVLEHVDHDRDFLRHVRRVLRPGGTFVMTTPNGDSIPIPHNPDHRRHYRRDALKALLTEVFDKVEVEYAIVGGRARSLGLRSWSTQHPWLTLAGMAGNVINRFQSNRRHVRQRALGTRHLVAIARG